MFGVRRNRSSMYGLPKFTMKEHKYILEHYHEMPNTYNAILMGELEAKFFRDVETNEMYVAVYGYDTKEEDTK